MDIEFIEYRCPQCEGHFIEPMAVDPDTTQRHEVATAKWLAARGALTCEPCFARLEQEAPRDR